MKPLAMTIQFVLSQEDRRMYAEIEIVLEDGSIVSKMIPANERLTLHFEDLAKVEPPKAA